MTDSLRVHLNRESVHDVEPEEPQLKTTGSFAILLENHGAPTHVHVRLDDHLATVADLPTPNYYVERDETQVVQVTVGSYGHDVEGAVEIMTGYGSTGERVPVYVERPDAHGVCVDERLGERPTAEESLDDASATARTVGPTVLAAAGVLLAVLAMLFVPDTAAILVGVVALFAGVGAAGYLLFWQ